MATIAQTRAGTTWDAERWSPLAGVVAVLLWIIGIVIAGDIENKDTGREILAQYNSDGHQILAAGLIWLIGTAFFIWFLGSLRIRLASAEGGPNPHFSAIAFAGGIVASVFLMLIPTANMVGVDQKEDLDASAALAINNIGDIFWIGLLYTAPVLLAATAVVALRTGAVLPRWLAWITLLMAIVMLVPVVGWAVISFAFPIWILLVVRLMWRPATTRTVSP
jgi:hypothetical protein